ncbi:hypothetical protein R5R35_013117 [Gryllus longicercus]|uniref:Uncharacterized protein n=1 Tax=Gryllus longicercus TaxID=2509291 RepID=A0AAN9ZIG6_9ORTH
MQFPKDCAPAAAAQVPAQSGAADEARAASHPRSPAREALPPSSPSSVASSSSSSFKPSSSLEDAIFSEETAAGGCVFLRRVRSLPAVQALLGAYAGAKAYPGVGWALSVGEKSALLATAVCRPVALVCRAPVSGADWCLCKGLAVAEAIFPSVSMFPSEVYFSARKRAMDWVCCPPRTVARCLASVCPGSQKD